MDEISVQSSESQNSSCSFVSYEGVDGYISDGEDPFYIQPEEDCEDLILPVDDSSSSSSDSDSERSKTSADYNEKVLKRQKQKNVKEIMNELRFGRSTSMLLNRNPVVPSYIEIAQTMQRIRDKYPKRSLDRIIERLHLELVQQPKDIFRNEILAKRNQPQPRNQHQRMKKQLLERQTEIAAQAFCQLGYGITKMRKYIEQGSLNIEIDIHTYEAIIRKIVLDAYRRLERFLRKKCHKSIQPLKGEADEKFLLDALKNCKNKLDTFQMHNFYKLIKLIYNNEKVKISKRIASRLYHTCQEHIMRKKLKNGGMDPENPDSEIYNTSKFKWSESMIQTAIDIYIKEGSLHRIREIMSKTYNIEPLLLENRNIKYHIENKVRVAIDRLRVCVDIAKAEGGAKLRELNSLDETKVKWILTSLHATNVRITLCQIYKSKEPSLQLLNQAVLAINQFVLQQQNKEMLQAIKKTDRAFDPVQNQFLRKRKSKRI